MPEQQAQALTGKAGRVAHADPFPLHGVPARRSRVEQHVHQVVVEQIHLIDVKQAAIGFGQ